MMHTSGATVQTSNDRTCEQTPCSIITPRKEAFTATVTKQGYQPQTVPVASEFSTNGGIALFGNEWLGGLIGIATDMYSGATHDLSPNKMTLTLQKDQTYEVSDAAGFFHRPGEALGISASAAPWNQGYISTTHAVRTTGRVIELRVLPDGSVQEFRETR